MLAATLLAFNSGVGIAAARAASELGSRWHLWVQPLLIDADLPRLHLLAVALLLSIFAGWLVFALRTGRAPVVAPAAPDDALAQGVLLARWLMQLGMLLTLLMGTLAWFYADQPSQHSLLDWHDACAWLMAVATLLWLLLQLASGGGRRLLGWRLSMGDGLAVQTAIGVSCILLALMSMLDRSRVHELVVSRVIVAPTLDGVADDAVWRDRPLTVLPTLDASGRALPMHLRAVRDESRAYFLIEWPDASRSFRHLPLRRHRDGWELQEKHFREGSERDYHEDALVLLLAAEPALGADALLRGGLVSDLGQPLAEMSRLDGLRADLWYWGAVRSALQGQAEDRAIEAGSLRNVADPLESGGVERNFLLRRGSRVVTPLNLPRDPLALRQQIGEFRRDPEASDSTPWLLTQSDARPLRGEKDVLEEGAVIPSLIDTGPMRGDRADVQAHAQWRDGWWHLELARDLDTGSSRDLPLRGGVYLSLGAFDHSQADNSRHSYPVRIEME
jgi:hypothetical protein